MHLRNFRPWGAVSRFKAPSRSWVVQVATGPPKPPAFLDVVATWTLLWWWSRWRWERRPKPPANHRETTGQSPVFGSLLPVSIRAGQGLSGVIFRALGGVAIRGPLFRLKVCTLRSDGVGGTGICGFLDVTKGILGPMTAFAGFHDKATPKGVYTSSYTPHKGGAYPLVVKGISLVLALTYVAFDPTPFWASGQYQ